MGIFSGVFGSSDIEGRKYDKELRRNYEAQYGVAGDVLAGEQEFRPQYQDLGLDLVRRAFGGGNLYADFLSGLSAAQAEGADIATDADITRRTSAAPGARGAVFASNPLLEALEAASMAEVGSYDLPPGLEREMSQDYRKRRAAMGLGYGESDALGEAGMLASTRYQINQANRDRAQSVAGQMSPLMERILGNQGPSISEGSESIGVSRSFDPGALFNPESPYAEGVRAGNNATRNAVTAQQEGVGFGALGMLGQAALGGVTGGMTGGWNPKAIGGGIKSVF